MLEVLCYEDSHICFPCADVNQANKFNFLFFHHQRGRPVAGLGVCGNSDAKVLTASRNTGCLRCMKYFNCCMYTSRQQTAAKEEWLAVGRLTNKEAKAQG